MAKSEALKPKRYCSYLLVCADGSFYAGSTQDLKQRLKLHNRGKGAKYLRGRTPAAVAYIKKHSSLSAALRAEIALKRLTRTQKQQLVKKYSCH